MQEFNVRPGDLVKEGDTLFSFIPMGWISEAINPNIISTADIRKIESSATIQKLRSRLQLEENSADSLKQITLMLQEDVNMGVARRAELEQQQWAYFKQLEIIEDLKRLVRVEQDVLSQYDGVLTNENELLPVAEYTLSQKELKKKLFGRSYQYRRAYTDMQIISINAKEGSLVKKSRYSIIMHTIITQ